jgi:tagatose 6-phosphate kinase
MAAKRILTVSVNAAVDTSYVIDHFAVDKINTVQSLVRMAGGKANNVARVLASLGESVVATGFSAGNSGRFIEEELRRNGVEPAYERVEGESRICLAIIDPAGRTLTEVREKGPTLTEPDLDRFIDRFRGLVRRADLVVMSGSLPPGVPADFYGQLVGEAYRVTQVRSIVDATGPALAQALKAQPYLVKPNLDELEEWVGAALPDDEAVLAAAHKLMEAGPLVVGVSLGARGLLLVSPEGAWRATPPAVDVVNTVGSGDSLVAGFAAGLMRGLPAKEVLQLAVACGTASALTTAVAVVRPDDLERIQPQVRVERLV